MQATQDSIVGLPKFQKTRLRTVKEEAFCVSQTNKQTNKQTDTQNDNKGHLELSGAREPTIRDQAPILSPQRKLYANVMHRIFNRNVVFQRKYFKTNSNYEFRDSPAYSESQNTMERRHSK